MNEFEVLEGEIYEIIYQNEENGYTVCEVCCNNSIVTVCGNMPFIAPGVGVKINGKWVTHPDYGEQFSAVLVERSMPKKASSVLAYLSSGIVSGVRESTARKIVRAFGEESLDIISLYPERLAEIKGISLSRAKKISESYLLRQDAAQTVIFLQEYGVSANAALKVHKRFGNKATELIKENPYILCENIERIGFKTADRIASEMNLPKNHPGRIASGIKYALLNASLSGHTCLEKNTLLDYSVRLLCCDIKETETAYFLLLEKGEIICEDGFVYLPMYYNTEKLTAIKLAEIMGEKQRKLKSLDDDIDIFSKINNIELSHMQREAVKKANSCGVLVITGGPGTGKTTIMKIIMEIFKKQELSIALCAPTGKAAKRLTESCGEEAKTLHRLLEVNATDGAEIKSFGKNEYNPLDADVVIIDEMSMVDIVIFAALLKALKKGTKLILAGDADQLPSVGAGNVLNDIIESGLIPTVRLNEVFRQAEESRIVINAHRINNGLMPLSNDNSKDFFFMNRNSEAALDTICELCCGRLQKAYGYDAISDIQVLSPSKKGVVGTQNLNRILQEKLNPPSKNKKEKKIGERIFRVGDKVIQTKNNYEMIWTNSDDSLEGMGIYNGDIGIIADISQKDRVMTIIFDDNKIVEYDFASIDDLETAYALTVHKSQGCEFNAVIIPVCFFPPMLMTRNLLYTAVTRAKQLVILVGSEESTLRMVQNDKVQIRYSGLKKKLAEAMGEVK